MSKLMKLIKSPRLQDLAWVLGLTLFAGFVYTDDLVNRGANLWDNIFFYSLFWNQLDSLNRFGEIAWWFPANQNGWPAYYYSILGDISASSPAFAFVGFFSWLCGRIGMMPSYYGLFTFHYAYLVPGLVNVAGYIVLRQLLKERSAVWFGVALMAFSPGVLVNIGDIGFLEPLGYSLFFLAAWIAFVREPVTFRFGLLALSICVLALTLGFPFLLWNVFFVPLSVVLVTLLPPGGWERAKHAFSSRPLWQWGVVIGLAGLCALPSLITFTHTGDFVRATLGQQFYDYRAIRMGNPATFLTISVPQFGYEWVPPVDGEPLKWSFLPGGRGKWLSMHYVALLALPLTIIGLLYARRWTRIGLTICIVFFGALVTLSGWSPILNVVIRWVRPFHSNDHWSDLGFRAGSYQLFIFMAAVGFGVIAGGHRRASRTLPFLIIASLAVNIAIFCVYDWGRLASNSVFSLMILLLGVMLAVSLWLWSSPSRRLRQWAVGLLLVLTVIDVSSFAFIHVRTTIETIGWRVLARNEIQEPDSVGLQKPMAMGHGDYAEHILMHKPHWEMWKANFYDLNVPRFMLFTAARADDSSDLRERVKKEKARVEQQTFQRYDSLLIDGEDAKNPEFAPFVSAAPSGPVGGSVQITNINYNHLDLKVASAAEALMFVRDAYSPFWKVEVNGREVPVARALFNYKAFKIPAGDSEIRMRFSPGIGKWLALAYLILIGVSAATWWWSRARREAPPQKKRR
jgi:hypothetical protein